MGKIDYVLTEEKKLIFKKLLEITKEFDRVCSENNLNYTLEGGTLIGAIREGGFIPWDDDVDILMPRADFDKLCKLAEEGVFKAPFVFENAGNTKGCPRMISKLRDISTTSISYDDTYMKIHHGMFIDIQAVDNFPDDLSLRTKQIKELKLITKLAGGYARYVAGVGLKEKSLKKKILYIALYPLYATGIITSKKMFKKFNEVSTRYNNVPCKEITGYPWLIYAENFHFPTKCMTDGYTTHKFEGIDFKIIKEYDLFLTTIFNDYMTPVQAPAGHSGLIQLPNVPYEKYFKEHAKEIEQKWFETM